MFRKVKEDEFRMFSLLKWEVLYLPTLWVLWNRSCGVSFTSLLRSQEWQCGRCLLF